jgi:growth hormone-inducible transmembrane protein
LLRCINIITMAFLLRRPFALANAAAAVSKQVAPKSFKSFATTRAFHNSPLKASPKTLVSSKPEPVSPVSSVSKFRNVFQQTFRRSYQQQSYGYPAQQPTQNVTQRLLLGAGLFGGTLVAINFLFNRETREDGGMPPFERAYLNQTFVHTGLGIGIIGVAASALHRSGWSYRLMAMNPWVVMGVSLVVSLGSMYGCRSTHPDK